ncbi:MULTISPECIES: phospholipase D family protein [Bordetella]|uniref:Phospholipase D domain protein n=1 Tax=Bordetella bronchiseptica 00-P-2796 TaxID=1331199 RepID=A0ABR4RLW8_BORBO|nr:MULTISPECIES: phospholipase D family protein [Bordetella]SHS92243.1 Cardiolipin synthase [Mycobacteroides abscessus subsp. abscessus]KCV38894.1 phospholipase D domain protein [Bordetella bronchiseptica 00-P-2796]KDC02374.1 phospholipase D domain protein [Bordetella bronchiseptica E012]KDC88298.1 phospholipase D domain protein [Bordetella bronchiseptica MBORD665]KDD14673.1 phospholipase D domain protein [Bordetella bronchiseptica MBORD731]
MPRLLSRIRAVRARAAALLALAGCAILLGACTLPPPVDRTASHALDASQARATPLGQGIGDLADAHPGLSGFHALGDAQDAFAARMLLARAATRTLDVQYYIWRNDMTGTLLLQALHAAAERGVRVRLLLDDNGISGLDDALAALDAHPNAEVRLFNPFPTRSFKALGYLTDFSRLNRRMHNKSFTVDNQATIIGGRNIGDEYFGATDGVLFADLDVLAVGPVVGDVSAEFDAYWASESAWPAGPLLPAPGAQTLRALAERAARIEQDPAAGDYMSALRELPFIRELMAGRLPLQWAPARMVSDDPAKGLGKAPPAGLLTQQLRNILGEPRRTLDLVSPYFVPTEAGTQAFAALARGGAQVRVLTNALEATDVAVVHSGYAKRRKALLQAGVRLYEMRRSYAGPKPQGRGRFGSSGSSLHAKTFGVDGERVFIGSFNFDPRSANLNTELGFVIESPDMARHIAATFDQDIPAATYEVRLDDDGSLYWLEQRDGATVRHDSEPGVSLWRRFSVWLFSLLPLEPLL